MAVASPPIAVRHGFDDGFLGHETSYAVNVNEQTALAVDTFFACVRTIADLTADAMVGEYEGSVRLDQQSRLVRRPMASITRRTWLWHLTSIMAIYNGAWLYRRFGRDAEGMAVSLEPVAPPRVNWLNAKTVHIDGQEVDPLDLVWVPRMTFPTVTRDMAYVIRLARESLAASSAAGLYTSGFWEKGGPTTTIITSDQDIGPDVAEKIANDWVTKRAENPGRPAVIGKGAHVNQLGADIASEGGTLALSRLGTSIARYFGMPAWLVNVPSEAGSLTYQNASAAGLDLVRYVLQPGYAGPIADAWSDELPGDPGDYVSGRHVVLDLSHLTLGTQLEQAQTYQILTGNKPIMLPSEVRDRLHLPIDMTLDETGAPAPAMEQIGVPTDG